MMKKNNKAEELDVKLYYGNGLKYQKCRSRQTEKMAFQSRLEGTRRASYAPGKDRPGRNNRQKSLEERTCSACLRDSRKTSMAGAQSKHEGWGSEGPVGHPKDSGLCCKEDGKSLKCRRAHPLTLPLRKTTLCRYPGSKERNSDPFRASLSHPCQRGGQSGPEWWQRGWRTELNSRFILKAERTGMDSPIPFSFTDANALGILFQNRMDFTLELGGFST